MRKENIRPVFRIEKAGLEKWGISVYNYCPMAVFTGYHGTREDFAVEIERNGFRISPARKGWLGAGVYFFESQPGFDGLADAEWWATVYKKYQDWAILKAEIVAEKVFDTFGSKKDRRRFELIILKFLEKHTASGGKVIDFNLQPIFSVLCKEFDVIRCLVDGAKAMGFVNYVVGYPQIQICVTKSECISRICMEKVWRQKNG